MGGWTDAILQALPLDGSAVPKGNLEVLCSQFLAESLDRHAFSESIFYLQSRKQIDCDAVHVWRTEPDFPERDIEDLAGGFLKSRTCLDALNINDDSYVFENTTVSGSTGAGLWSRPDFTLAAIRRFKYDPRRYLDVYSFELKNRRGTSVVAVHEALAHGRFAHFAYLVCPRSSLDQTSSVAIRQACMDHGVGLITFDLSVGEADEPVATDFRFEANPQKRNIDPAEVDRHLDARLSLRGRTRLAQMASTS